MSLWDQIPTEIKERARKDAAVPKRLRPKQWIRVPCVRCGGEGSVPDQRSVGAYYRARREAAGLSLREVARRLRLSAGYVSDLELGRRAWGSGMRERWERVL